MRSPVPDEVFAGRLCRARGGRSPRKPRRNRDRTLSPDFPVTHLCRPRQDDVHHHPEVPLRPPEGNGCKTVGQYREGGWGLAGVVVPAVPSRAPTLKEVAQPGSGNEDQNGEPVVRRGDDHELDQDQGDHRKGLIEGRPHEVVHHHEKDGKDDPVEPAIQDRMLLWEQSALELDQPEDREVCEPPGGNDPKGGAFLGEIGPNLGLRSPRLDRQTSHETYKEEDRILAQIRSEHDQQGDEGEDPDEQPVHPFPEVSARRQVGEVRLRQRPPHVSDHEGEHRKGADHVAARVRKAHTGQQGTPSVWLGAQCGSLQAGQRGSHT